MQLKRDTGYALGLLLAVAKKLCDGRYKPLQLSSRSIAELSALPLVTSERLCRKLVSAGILENGKSVGFYCARRSLLDVSMLDIMIAIEDHTDINILLDGENPVFQQYRNLLFTVGRCINNSLNHLTVLLMLKYTDLNSLYTSEMLMDESGTQDCMIE